MTVTADSMISSNCSCREIHLLLGRGTQMTPVCKFKVETLPPEGPWGGTHSSR